MDDASPDERIALALARALMRKGLLDAEDIAAAADEIDAESDGEASAAAHRLRCTVIEASVPSQPEWEAGRARSRFRIIDGGEKP